MRWSASSLTTRGDLDIKRAGLWRGSLPCRSGIPDDAVESDNNIIKNPFISKYIGPTRRYRSRFSSYAVIKYIIIILSRRSVDDKAAGPGGGGGAVVSFSRERRACVCRRFAETTHYCRRPPRPAITHSSSSSSQQTRLYLFKDFFTELDKFLDDASARRLGNGAAFYGKRKSNFYGANDKNRKIDTNVPDPTEDYQAPNAGGYFQWMKDENGQMRPVTRMKKQVVERNMKFWDNVYADDNDDDNDDNRKNKQKK
jgi:hypothetical protein